MTEDIYTKAQLLADAISASAELLALKQAEKRLSADTEAQRIIVEFQDAQDRLTALQKNGTEPSHADLKAVETLETQMENNHVISFYLEAQDHFTEMLDKVNTILAAAMAGEKRESDCLCTG